MVDSGQVLPFSPMHTMGKKSWLETKLLGTRESEVLWLGGE